MEKKELAPVSELFPPQGQWTEADFFALPETNRLLELSEGRLIVHSPPTLEHQEALKRLFIRLNAFVEKNELGVVELAPLPVRLWPGKIREPDIFFISREHLERLGEKVCGVPDLAVEVTSPATRDTDRREKFGEYAQAGVQEYWIVDPERKTIEVFVLRGGAFETFGLFRPGEIARSALLSGFEVPVDEIFLGSEP